MWSATHNEKLAPRFLAERVADVRLRVSFLCGGSEDDNQAAWRRAYRDGWRIVPVTIERKQ